MLKPYIVRTKGSNGAKTLAGLLDCKRNKLGKNPIYVPKNRLVINWGNTRNFNAPLSSTILNRPEFVNNAVDKRTTFRILENAGINTPTSFTSLEDVATYRLNCPRAVMVARSIVGGHSGQGITIVRPGEEMPSNTLLTTLFVKKKAEYRFHVVQGEVILQVQKRKRSDVEHEEGDQRAMIRSYDNGWIFAINNVEGITEEYRTMAVKAVQALGLNFGAVDFMVGHDDVGYVLEVNTAPAIEGESTRLAYKNAFAALAAA